MKQPPSASAPQKAVTLKDVAARCGVHVVTASRALHGDLRYVSREKAAYITEVAREMGYDPSRSHAARSLRLSRHGQRAMSQLFAAFFPRDFHTIPYFLTLFQGLMDALQDQQYGVVPLFGPGAQALPPVFTRGDIDGIITLFSSPEVLDFVHTLRVDPHFGPRPVLALIEPVPGAAAILIDDVAGGYAAASHLLDLGHRHLLHFCQGDDDEFPHRQRFLGYQQAYRERGLNPETYLHRCVGNGFTEENAVGTFLGAALDAYPEVTGILARHDQCALLIARVLRERQRMVPGDISLVGYDDTDALPGPTSENSLTTVQVPLREIGRRAATLMIRMVTEPTTEPETIVLPAPLIVRASTAPPRS